MSVLPPPDPRALDRAADLIKAASRPVVIAGGQCGPEEAPWLHAFAESLMVPVLATREAKGALPGTHPLALGIFAAGGGDDALLRLADLVITFGLESPEVESGRWPFAGLVVCLSGAPHSGYPFTPLVEVVGELSLILEELAPRLRGKTQADWDMWELDRLRRASRR